MKIGVDCDGVLRDFTAKVKSKVIELHPKLESEIKPATSWGWKRWLPFWSYEETESFIFKENYLDIFENAPVYTEAVEDWPVLMRWAKEKEHEIVLVSSQRKNCIDPTNRWLDKYNFIFDQRYYISEKWMIDVNILIDDSPHKLKAFKQKSVSKGLSVRMDRLWNQSVSNSYLSISRLSDVIGIVDAM
jgi:5'(3')-deoxyribonucleotidase